MITYLEFDATGKAIGSHSFEEEPGSIPPGYIACTPEQLADGANCTLINGVIVVSPNADILRQIRALEETITPRRMREATLGTDGGWLKGVDSEIAKLRASLI